MVSLMPACVNKTILAQIVFALLGSGFAASQSLPADDQTSVDAFERDYATKVIVQNSEIDVPISGGKISASAAANAGQQRYVQMVIREFRIYPRQFIKAARLKRIVICSKLAFNGQLRAAIPDFASGTLYLDQNRGAGSGNYQQAVVHHEFFHLVDFQDDGIVYEDTHWKTLNASRFSYGSGGASVQQDSGQSGFRKPTNGFLTKYSTAGVEEDKAELFAHLIVSPKVVANAVESDQILDQKVATLKALMQRFCPELNERFWKKVAAR